jgi:Tfp pilus assembly protein PilF
LAGSVGQVDVNHSRGNDEVVARDFLKPRQSNHKYPTDFLLGDLLVKAGIVSQKQLDEAVQHLGGKNLNVGQMLIVSRYITARDLQVAVDAQSALRDRVVDLNTAVRGLKSACRTGVPFSEAIKDTQDPASTKVIPTNKLGELLLEAGIIDGDQFGKALQRSLSTGLPLGRILVLNGAISDSLLTTALEIQVRTRDGLLTRHEAIEYLKVASNQITGDGASPEKALKIQALLKAPRKSGIRLGELFVLARILAETDVMNALELGLVNDQPIGHILVSQGFISPELLESALKLQDFVDKDILDTTQAANCLNQIHTTGVTFSESVGDIEITEESRPDLNFQTLLTLARIVSDEDIQNAFDQALMSPELVATVLMMAGYIDEPMSQAALRCHGMVQNGELTQEDALVALDFCIHKMAERTITYDEALQELGWIGALADGSTDTVPTTESAPIVLPDQSQEAESQEDAQAETAQPETISFAVNEQASVEQFEEVPSQAEPEASYEEESETITHSTLEPISSGAFGLDELTVSPGNNGGEDDSESNLLADTEMLEEASETVPSEDWNLPELPVPADDLAQGSDHVELAVQTEQSESASPEQTPAAAAPEKAVPEPVKPVSSQAQAVVKPAETAAKANEAKTVTAPTYGHGKSKKGTLKNLLSGSATSMATAGASAGAQTEGKTSLDGKTKDGKSGELELTEEEQLIIARASSLSATLEDIEAAARIVARKEQSMKGPDTQKSDSSSESNLQGQSVLEMKKKIDDLESDKKKDLNLPAIYSFLSKMKRHAKALPIPSSKQSQDLRKVEARQLLALKARHGFAAIASQARRISAGFAVGDLDSDFHVNLAQPANLPGPLPGHRQGIFVVGDVDSSIPTWHFEPSDSPAKAPLPLVQERRLEGFGVDQGEPDMTLEQLAEIACESVLGHQGESDAAPMLVDAGIPTRASSKPKLEGLNIDAGLSELKSPGTEASEAAKSSGPPLPTGNNGSTKTNAAGAKPSTASMHDSLTEWQELDVEAKDLKSLSEAIASADKGEDKFILGDAFLRLAESYYQQGDFQAAEKLYERILALREKEGGENSSAIVSDLNNLAGVLCVQAKFEKAQAHVERALALLEANEPDNYLKLADCLNTLAGIHYQQEKYEVCEPFLTRALELRTKVLGENHPDIADNLRDYAKLLRKTNRLADAERVYLKAKAILSKSRKKKDSSGQSDR